MDFIVYVHFVGALKIQLQTHNTFWSSARFGPLPYPHPRNAGSGEALFMPFVMDFREVLITLAQPQILIQPQMQ
jgi:hypothetical protein